MNTLYLILAFIISSSTMYAQITNMTIHETGGNSVSFVLSNIDSVTFSMSSATTCPVSFVDSRDNEVYSTVQIGNQCWMAENLRFFKIGSWLNPGNPNALYGRLYSWNTVMNGEASSSSHPSGVQGICPNGWHLPSDDEWSQLEISLGMDPNDVASGGYRGTHGLVMKSTTGWNSAGNGTNASGFNVFPSGLYNNSVFPPVFSWIGDFAYFHSTTESIFPPNYLPLQRYLSATETGVTRGIGVNNQQFGYSCRCVKN